MRFIISLLSVLLIFAGIAGVMYVDWTEQGNERGNKISTHQELYKTEMFVNKLSMREIDSITSEKNYSFTIHNAIAANSIDTLQDLTASRQGL